MQVDWAFKPLAGFGDEQLAGMSWAAELAVFVHCWSFSSPYTKSPTDPTGLGPYFVPTMFGRSLS